LTSPTRRRDVVHFLDRQRPVHLQLAIEGREEIVE